MPKPDNHRLTPVMMYDQREQLAELRFGSRGRRNGLLQLCGRIAAVADLLFAI